MQVRFPEHKFHSFPGISASTKGIVLSSQIEVTGSINNDQNKASNKLKLKTTFSSTLLDSLAVALQIRLT